MTIGFDLCLRKCLSDADLKCLNEDEVVALQSEVLKRPLASEIPQRILPVCARPPADLGALFEVEFADIKRMVAPGSRKRLDARAKLRSMAILQASLDGKKSQPSDGELDRVATRINSGENWRQIFPGVATLTIVREGNGLACRSGSRKKRARPSKSCRRGHRTRPSSPSSV